LPLRSGLAAAYPETMKFRVIQVLAMRLNEEFVIETLRAGAVCYLTDVLPSVLGKTLIGQVKTLF
jgi:hypothetical protein